MSLADDLYQTGARLAEAPLKGASAAIDSGRTVERRVRGQLGEAIDGAVLATIDALLARLLADDVIDRVLDRIEQSGVAQRIAERLLDDGIAEQIAERALAGPEAERMLAAALRGPLVEETVAKLLENQATWVLVDEIARSPSVTEAIAHQGSGFLDEVAARARDRSRHADARVQRLADKLRRRPPAAPVPPPGPALPDPEQR
jgi:hypothetical protein